MRRILLFAAALLLHDPSTPPLRASASSGPAGLEGSWEGFILVRPGEFEVEARIEIRRAADGALGGHLSYPLQGPREYALDKVELEGESVLITSTDPQGIISIFQGAFDAGAETIRGDLVEGGEKAPFSLHRRRDEARRRAVLETLTPSGFQLKTRFNRELGMVRVVMILSPSCAICRMGARLVQRHLLTGVPDARVSLYVLWEKIGSQDTPDAAQGAADLVAGDRVHQYWSREHFGSSAFAKAVGIQKTGAWDFFLLFPPEAKWLDAAPPFVSFMHNQKAHTELPQDRLLHADRLVEEVRGVLAAAPSR